MKFISYLILALCLPWRTQAQTCTGNFGDPVVNLDFSSGINPGPTSATNYNYTTNNCPNDGSYTIASTSPGCFGGNWHTINQDHTPGDTNGYMMLVNASNSPGEFFKQQINELCQGTTYEFAAYVMNVLKPSAAGIKPNLTFIIESPNGAELGKYSTNNIVESAVPEWTKHAMIFTTPPGISQIVLKIINNAPGGNGNDLALDDITFRACGPTIQPSVNGRQSDFFVCEGLTSMISLDATISPGFSNPAYQWQINENSSGWRDIAGANSKNPVVSLTAASGMAYQYRLAVAESFNISSVKCRILSAAILVSSLSPPAVNAGPDKATRAGRPVTLEGSATGASLTYLWSPSAFLDDPTKPDPKASPVADITYTLTVTNECNVSVTDQVFVKVYEEINIPNTFTPNGDGVNDIWNIPGLISYPEARISVFNRFGSAVYSSLGYSEPWDGRFKSEYLPQGVYYYMIDLNNGEKVISGNIAILK